jgi:DNA-binding NtrC family response regulator
VHEPDLAGLSILIVEDDVLLRKQIAAQLERLAADVTGTGELASARKLAEELGFDFVLLDVNLPDGRGTDLLKDKVLSPNTGTIIMTADGAVATAVEAIRLGALDYLVKPFDPGELPLVIARVRRARQSARLEEHRRSDSRRTGSEFLFGPSLSRLEAKLQKILAADERMQTGLSPVLLEGETGTGKTSICRWLHHHGPRASQPLVEVNCSALPEPLAESELFGHERGAFTDARTARIGLFEAANGGTLFLDELPSLSPGLQAKLLKVIEDHKIRRLGGNKEIPVDVRIVAATNRKLKEVVAAGQFREDLYHRLDLFHITLPPLRERGEDILKLAEVVMHQLTQRHRLPRKTFTETGRQRLLSYPWPGNVRELAHELERAIVFEESEELNFEHLAGGTPGTASQSPDPSDWFNPNYRFPGEGFQLEAAINRLIQHALNQTDQNVSAAARLLGVSRDYLRYRLSDKRGQTTPGD